MNIETFFLAAVIVVVTPGIDTIMVLTRSISNGRKAGLYSALGVGLGLLVHTCAAGFGLSAVIAKSAFAFHFIKYLGAAYLFYVGIRGLVESSSQHEIISNATERSGYRKMFFSALLSDILNPKIAIFFLAFLPQFISSSQRNNPLPYLSLGLIIFLITLVWCMALAFAGGKAAVIFNRNRLAQFWLFKLSAFVFIFLGIKLALIKK
jgi:threonine/homoserine/homoserine lactone efflux protein